MIGEGQHWIEPGGDEGIMVGADFAGFPVYDKDSIPIHRLIFAASVSYSSYNGCDRWRNPVVSRLPNPAFTDMLLRLGYDLQFELASPVAMTALLLVHPSRREHLREPDEIQSHPAVPVHVFEDRFGNLCGRFLAPAGMFRLHGSTLIEDAGEPDPICVSAQQVPVERLPAHVLDYLLPSRYCTVDLLAHTAREMFGGTDPGWPRVQAICNWVHSNVMFGYNFARPTKTALDVYIERTGVCRDFQHLAITFCRALNIPARYTAGYLGDIGVPPAPSPMDFSAWFEVYLEDRWWVFDARHNQPRIGRVMMAAGRDATDAAITTSFGSAVLKSFAVVSDQA
jgi:transglutaminase-like putative cysteine protease